MGEKEESPDLRDAENSFGEQHQMLNKQTNALLHNIEGFSSHVSTFFTKAVQDTVVTSKKFNACRLEYDSFKNKLTSLEHEQTSKGTNPKVYLSKHIPELKWNTILIT